MEVPNIFLKYCKTVEDSSFVTEIGKVIGVSGLIIRGYVPGCSLGSICEIYSLHGEHMSRAEVVGFDGQIVLLMSLGTIHGVGLGSKIVLQKTKATIGVGPELLGRVVDGLGYAIDNHGLINVSDEMPLYSEAERPLQRDIINKPLSTGVRAIDGLLTLGEGQRVAIMAGSGVGKSMLLGQIARASSADINVIALIGERGREVKEFIEYSLGEEGLMRSVVVAVTSDQSPLLRMRGAYMATAIAEYFAQKNNSVLLMMDSITRFSMAQREIGLSAGEPPTAKGYTPSVFSSLPKLLERAGNFAKSGSITGIYSVLVEGDDMDDPIADAVRSIADGHIVLDRKLAHRNHYPAIDILQSTSRVMRNIVPKNMFISAQEMRENIAIYRDTEDLIHIGAYRQGANSKIDRAVNLNENINNFLKQDADERSDMDLTYRHMLHIFGGRP